ncbi:hypothetical protein H4R33_005883 [Dimargaris cristalligena]|uniref:tRNA N(3)-methylcytidine methyltransferase n=1 Tax=Dimargaris cristalligena TaxID=215637 RepID=A0A4V1J5D1_9FUNG|nr:hypothetical protein H4R33_005883 [Dimargaris cristalligena]RKP38639.1 methyltransferase-like protein 6 [Dimargaris cristalligena]|eukprot:RKP38639.1 methyltransferase-like protein 6 [Dimargaris cristalligena]
MADPQPEYVDRAKQILAQDTKVVPEFWVKKYRQEASKNWDKFYKRNTTNFFKDRHWIEREFHELQSQNGNEQSKLTLLEVGCGVGNFLFPLLESHPNLFVYACDFSSRAVGLVQANPLYTASDRCKAFVCDLTQDALTDSVPPATVDLISMIFVLSAIPPEKMDQAVANVFAALRPGGKVLFRDYGLYDAAQLRFKSGSKLEDNFYVRQDGTMAYYFSRAELEALFRRAGFVPEMVDNIFRKTTNVKQNLDVDRIFVQAKFVKPL